MASKICYEYCYACPKCSRSSLNVNASAHHSGPYGVWNSSSVSYSGCMRLRFSLWCCHQPWQGLMGHGVVSQTRPNQPQCRSLSVSHMGRKGLMTTSRFPCAHGTHQTLEKCSVKSIIKSKYMYFICHGGLLIQQFYTLRLAQRHVTVANQIIYACTNHDVAHRI